MKQCPSAKLPLTIAAAFALIVVAETPALAHRWVGTWACAPAWADSKQSFTNVTLREIVHVSVAGKLVRVRFSNVFGVQPLRIAHATLAIQRRGAATTAVPRELTAGGASSFTVAPHAQSFSDALQMDVRPGGNLVISLYVHGPTGAPTEHPLAMQTTYSATGDRATDAGGTAFSKLGTAWYFISGVDVDGSSAAGSVVALGDSITDGWHSSIDANGRWPDVLARRLLRLPRHQGLGVLNEGISGDRILLDGGLNGPNALSRFDRDVLAQSGVKDVIVFLGINDMQEKPEQRDAGRLFSGLLQLAVQAHERGIRIFACTVLPAEGDYAYSSGVEATRQAFNALVRGSRAFDGVFDFERALRDPTDPHRMLPAYDSGDHLHPSTLGLRAIASAVDVTKL
ncbi:MAG TPA: SGNH/GDSL hydrolase family protein [Candidatus Baltobacteraceae bacterium]